MTGMHTMLAILVVLSVMLFIFLALSEYRRHWMEDDRKALLRRLADLHDDLDQATRRLELSQAENEVLRGALATQRAVMQSGGPKRPVLRPTPSGAAMQARRVMGAEYRASRSSDIDYASIAAAAAAASLVQPAAPVVEAPVYSTGGAAETTSGGFTTGGSDPGSDFSTGGSI